MFEPRPYQFNLKNQGYDIEDVPGFMSANGNERFRQKISTDRYKIQIPDERDMWNVKPKKYFENVDARVERNIFGGSINSDKDVFGNPNGKTVLNNVFAPIRPQTRYDVRDVFYYEGGERAYNKEDEKWNIWTDDDQGFKFLEKPTTVSFDQATMDKFFQVKIPDPNDTEWLAERKRLLSMPGITENDLKTMKPLGREQRMIVTNRSLAQAMTDNEKLEIMAQAIKQDQATQGVVLGQIAKILAQMETSTDDIEQNVIKILNATRVTIAKEDYGFKSRYLGHSTIRDIYNDQKQRGIFKMYVSIRGHKMGGQHSAGRPIISTKGNPIQIDGNFLKQFESKDVQEHTMKSQRVLDLDDLVIYEAKQFYSQNPNAVVDGAPLPPSGQQPQPTQQPQPQPQPLLPPTPPGTP